MPHLSPREMLAHFPKLTYRRFQKLSSQPGLIEDIDSLELVDFVKAGWEEGVAHDFIAWRETIDRQKMSQMLERENISVIDCNHAAFPRLLKEINDPPAALFVRGTIPKNTEYIAIVGTRKNTPYGKQVTIDFSSALAQRGLCLVSGLALGTDGFVHEAALEYSAPTIAVLGSGVDRQSVYPHAHGGLADRIIAQGGAIISEYPPGFTPTPYSFPARNRIIAGLCRATLVTEAPIDSGALITARAALDYNRDVLAIPHAITSSAGEGTNLLIKQGAHVALKPSDILEVLGIDNESPAAPPAKIEDLSDTERTLLATLSREPLHIDRINKLSALAPALVASSLLMLEMKGLVKNTGAQHYIRR